MKSSLLLLATITSLFGLALAPQNAEAETLFLETFSNTTKVDTNLASVSWNAYQGSTGETLDNTASTSTVPYIPYSQGADGSWGFLSPGPFERTSILVITDKIGASNINIADIGSITFEQRNNRPDNNLRLAIQIDSEWYVSAQGFNSTVNSIWATAEINLADASWNRLSFTPDNTMLMEGSAQIPLSGLVTAIGFFSTSAQGAMRIDNLAVHSIPEASTVALSSIVVASLFLFRAKLGLQP